MNMCEIDGCHRSCCAGSHFCENHACMVDACPNPHENGSNFCESHNYEIAYNNLCYNCLRPKTLSEGRYCTDCYQKLLRTMGPKMRDFAIHEGRCLNFDRCCNRAVEDGGFCASCLLDRKLQYFAPTKHYHHHKATKIVPQSPLKNMVFDGYSAVKTKHLHIIYPNKIHELEEIIIDHPKEEVSKTFFINRPKNDEVVIKAPSPIRINLHLILIDDPNERN